MPTGQFPNVAYAWITTISAVRDFSNLAVANTPTAKMRSTSRATSKRWSSSAAIRHVYRSEVAGHRKDFSIVVIHASFGLNPISNVIEDPAVMPRKRPIETHRPGHADSVDRGSPPAPERRLGRCNSEMAETGRDPAGEIALFGFLILIASATFIPYRLWRWTHRLMGVFIAVGAFDCLFVLKPFSLLMSLSQRRPASPRAIQGHPRSDSGPRPSSPGQS